MSGAHGATACAIGELEAVGSQPVVGRSTSKLEASTRASSGELSLAVRLVRRLG